MDPEVTLHELRKLAAKFYDDRGVRAHGGRLKFDDARRMAELFHDLDAWLICGGFLPQRWDVPRGAKK